jgi:GNAT superfamily N-acetyltransferase
MIARHRALVFRDMGTLSAEEAEQLFTSSVPRFNRLLATQEYLGWLAPWQGEVVSGGGIHLREMGPIPGCPRLGRWGHIANIYAAQTHRRRGLARLLMTTILEWSEINQLDRLTLTAWEDGKPLYEALGFTFTADMQHAERL